jgi:hypothetical protein
MMVESNEKWSSVNKQGYRKNCTRYKAQSALCDLKVSPTDIFFAKGK